MDPARDAPVAPAAPAGDPRLAPADYDPHAYPPFGVTVDVVVLTVVDDALRVALIRRGEQPYLGWWALPGGFKRPDETLDEAAARELHEEAGAGVPRLRQFGAYGDPGRDPRMDVVSVAYLATVPDRAGLRAGTDATAAAWVPVDAILDGDLPLAFDHARIVADAHARLADDLERGDAVLSLLPTEFTVSQLRRTYEAVWRLELPADVRGDFVLDKRNLRRALATPPGPFLTPTGRSTSDLVASSRPGRPAALHRATAAWQEGAPVRRPRRRG